MKNIVILGSTGSIGRNTIKVVQNLKGMFKVFGIAANSNIEQLAIQAKELGCKKVVCGDLHFKALRKLLPNSYEVSCGLQGMTEIVTAPDVDIVLCAVVGTSALFPVLEAIKAGKDIAIASKEILVMAGELVMQEATKRKVKMIPVDSEHSAIFQCLEGKKHSDVSKIILTASGGAFLHATQKQINNATVKEALKHPTWNMGKKVTIDSASLMNKALEIIEARWLFNISADKIDVVVHPQSIIHSMVEFIDGTILAQMSITDMKFPIQYALTYPEKFTGQLQSLNLSEVSNLTFERPDRKRFPSLDFAYWALNDGGTLSTVMNAANEIAVEEFIKEKIKFGDIWQIIEKVMNAHHTIVHPSLDEIIAADLWAKDKAKDLTCGQSKLRLKK